MEEYRRTPPAGAPELMASLRLLAFAGTGIGLIVLACLPLQARLIWNRTPSAPTGLYWLSERPPRIGDWALVSAGAPEAVWAHDRGYTGPYWPLIKHVAASEGDEICRYEGSISINGNVAAIALRHDSEGMELPVWEGCFQLGQGQIFLLNDHPRSLDGRYFGVTDTSDIAGTVSEVWTDQR